MNEDTFFYDTMLVAKTTVDNELRLNSDKFYKKEVIMNNETCYRTVIEWERCMGELLIE